MAEIRIVNAGPVGLKPKGDYSSVATYTLYDTVFYNHDSWMCKAMNPDGTAATITGIAPEDGSQYWQALTDGGRAAYAEGETAKTKGENAESKAAIAQEAANNANEKASLADEKATLADTKAALAQQKADYAEQQGDYAKNMADHPSYIADGTPEKAGDKNYEYHWDYATQQYVRGNYMKGDDLDYSTITEEEKARLIENVKASLVFAAEATCEDIVSELT